MQIKTLFLTLMTLVAMLLMASYPSNQGKQNLQLLRTDQDSTLRAAHNEAPVIRIILPGKLNFSSDEVIEFIGSADDPEEGPIDDSLLWISDVDGIIGAGAAFSTQLSPGKHLIFASARDSHGTIGSTSIRLKIDNP